MSRFAYNEAFAFDEVDQDERPLRPGIPMLLPMAIAMWSTAAASYSYTAEMQPTTLRFLCIVALVAAMLISLVAFWRKARVMALVLCFAFLGVSLGTFGSLSYEVATEDFPTGQHNWTFELVSDPTSTEFGSYADTVTTSDQNQKMSVRAYFDGETEMLAGNRFIAQAALSSIPKLSREACRSNGIEAKASIAEYERISTNPLRQALCDLRFEAISLMSEYGGRGSGVMQALVCGYRGSIRETGDYDLFKQCGLAHIVAVSGAHLAIVTMVFGSLMRMLRTPRWLVFAASAAFVLAYLAFSGVPISAVRASVMVMLSMSAGIMGRRNASLNSLAICIIAFVAIDPVVAVSISFFLSAASTLGIVLLASLAQSWFSGLPHVLKKTVSEPVALTLSSNVATLPFSVATFGQLPLVALLANIVATPLFTIGCVCGLVSAIIGCVVSPIAHMSIALGSITCLPLLWTVQLMSSIPYSCIALSAPAVPMLALSALAVAALWWFWPALRLRSLALGACACMALSGMLAFFVGSLHGDELVMMDVGQGDAILVRSGNSALLVDTGNVDSKLREGLTAEGIFHLDAVVVTHPDSDHCASLASLFGYVEVDRFLCAKDMLSCSCDKCGALLDTAQAGVGNQNILGLSVGDAFAVGSFDLKVVWPNAYVDGGGNSDSVCLLACLDYDEDGDADWSALLTGDAESDQLEQMISDGSVGDIDILKVGHHGSKVTLSDSSAQALMPEIALISVGEGNRYGHPSDEALEKLGSVGAEVFRTDEDGTVKISFSESGLRVE